MKKKTIAILCVVLAVVLAAGGFTAHHLITHREKKPHEPDFSKAPVPMVIDVEPVLIAPTLEEALPLKRTLTGTEAEKAKLFGKTYPAKVYQSEDMYTDDNGIEMPVLRWTEFFAEDGSALYTYIVQKEKQIVFDASGTILFSCDGFKPKSSFETEPMYWFYKDGEVALGELNFYDGEDYGCAYFGADGSLLGARTEYARPDDKGEIQVQLLYFDGKFVMIDKEAFDALIPETDAPSFLQINWE